MRRPLAGQASKVSSSNHEKTISAPVGGLNSRDPITAMPRTDALVLDNFVCDPMSVKVRKGQQDFVTAAGTGAKIWALLPYRAAPNDRMFACTDAGIIEVTTAGTIGAASTVCTNGRWESVNGANAGIHYLLAVNGVDPAKLFNGTVWSNAAITGVDPATLTNVHLFKARAFFTEKDTLNFWYLAVNAVQGAATVFPLGAVFARGGSILAIGSWTFDGGSGMDDYAAFITTEGELALYKGTDPANADAWSLVGVYNMPRPIGRKCFYKYGGDLLLITESGLVKMSKMLQSTTIDQNTSITDKVVGEVGLLASAHKAKFGWSLTLLSSENLLILNIPIEEGVRSIQYVMNTLTGSWSTFSGLNAFCMLELGARLFYGTKEKVVHALIGNSDFTANIRALARTAYTHFGFPLKGKQVKLLRVNFTTSKAISVNLAIGVNYENTNYVSPASSGSNALAIYDVSRWDQANWGGTDFTVASWRSVAHKPGYALCLLLEVNAKEYDFSWNATDYLLAVGSALG